MATLIDDGFTRDGYIAAAPAESNGERLHESLSFKYRVATRRDLVRHEASTKAILANVGTDPESSANAAIKAEEAACQFVADRVPEWDAKTPKGDIAPISIDSFLRIHPILFNSMYSMVRGWRTSDLKPHETSPPQISNEEQQKNSEAVSG